jgi:hypothetical protein
MGVKKEFHGGQKEIHRALFRNGTGRKIII